MKRLSKGFTLIEVIIVVAILGILAAIAYPSYADYIKRGKIPEGLAPLSDGKVKMERFFMDNKKYTGGCSQPGLNATLNHFTIACSTPTDTTFTLIATGTGSMGDFEYKIDEKNVKTTVKVPSGWSGTGNTCWVLSKSGSC